MEFFSCLPEEIALLIFSHLRTAKDVCALGATAKALHRISSDESLWKDILTVMRPHFPVPELGFEHFRDFGKTWLWLCKAITPLKGDTGVGTKDASYEDLEISVCFQGDFVDGKLHGYGVHLACASSGKTIVHEGEWREGKKHGLGYNQGSPIPEHKLAWDDWELDDPGEIDICEGKWRYEGEWANGREHGTGKLSLNGREFYNGQLDHGMFDGQGTYTYRHGAVYDGQWRMGRMHGSGKMTWAGGDTYEGDWKDGVMEGRGTYNYDDGDDDNRDEKRNAVVDNREFLRDTARAGETHYVGEFERGERHGIGMVTQDDGTCLIGKWTLGKRMSSARYSDFERVLKKARTDESRPQDQRSLEDQYRIGKAQVKTIANQIAFAVWCARMGLNERLEDEMEECGGGVTLNEPECYGAMCDNVFALKIMKQKRWRIDAFYTGACVDYASRFMTDERVIEYVFVKCFFFKRCREEVPVGYWTTVKTCAAFHGNEALTRLACTHLVEALQNETE